MAKQVINTGTLANDGTGDTLRQAGDKMNANFTELYQLFGGGAVGTTTLTDSGLDIIGTIYILYSSTAVFMVFLYFSSSYAVLKTTALFNTGKGPIR